MRLKTKLVLAITALVFAIAGILSLVYVSQLLHSAVQQSYDTNRMVAEQIRFALQNALETGLRDRTVNPNDPAQLRNMEAEAVRTNAELQAVVDSVNRYSFTVYDINIGDSRSSTLLSTNPDNEDNPLPVRPELSQLLGANALRLMMEVFGTPRVFEVVVPLESNGKPFATVHVGVRTTFLRAVYAPWLKASLTFMGFALAAALTTAFLLSNLALRPLEQISRQLDTQLNSELDSQIDSRLGPQLNSLTAAGQTPSREEEARQQDQDMPERVSRKIERFGQRMRNVEEVYSALRENLDRILGNLQDGILLFTGDGRAVLVSEAARRFLGAENVDILGSNVGEIFNHTTVLGRTLIESFDARVPLIQHEIATESGKRIQASLDFIHDGAAPESLGALVTLHDIESAEEIESELELSRRMAAIGRLTSGVGHEVKNPINAIVVHLELLKSKLEGTGPDGTSVPAFKHLNVIETEIHRLDRVVQMLVDFSRPVELQLREQDLCAIVWDVIALASAELATRNVTLLGNLSPQPLMANVDADLFKQAVLNVIQNGAQAMPEGGTLEVHLDEDGKTRSGGPGDKFTLKSAVLRIVDQGPGIPAEIRDKIFDLYFTTKSAGSGIGLAMTYRILQLHHGSIEVQSRPGSGAEFLLRIPLASREWRTPAAIAGERAITGERARASEKSTTGEPARLESKERFLG